MKTYLQTRSPSSGPIMPVLLARLFEDEITLEAWCPYCACHHIHGAAGGDGEGHRVAHCFEKRSPFKETGYILKLDRESKKRNKTLKARARRSTDGCLEPPAGISPESPPRR